MKRIKKPRDCCAVCHGMDMENACLSSIILRPGYGSVHDMEIYTVNLCGSCIDWLIEALSGSGKGWELYRNSGRCPLRQREKQLGYGVHTEESR